MPRSPKQLLSIGVRFIYKTLKIFKTKNISQNRVKFAPEK
ncbi:hypothetical protein CKA32_006394 [Geitlerinema sp. FC II]|nr:hypothetical protein CKA32_006394 [Geitlerinema sp. FC II]